MNNILFALVGALIMSGMTYSTLNVDVSVPEIVEVTTVDDETPEDINENDITGDNFTDRLYSVMPEDKNYMYSPYSIKLALAMAANGAEGTTKTEILDTLGISNINTFNTNTADTIKKYSSTNVLRLDIANSIWLNTDTSPYDFSDKFKNTVKTFYDGEAREVTLGTAVPEVNKWVNEKTNGKIPSVIKDTYDAALVNAIYFKGNWKTEFNEKATAKDIFTDRNGKETEIDFMNTLSHFMYGESDGVRVLELPYKTVIDDIDEEKGTIKSERIENTDVSMFVLLSDKEICEPEKIVSELCDGNKLTSKKTQLSLPKFKIEFDREMSQDLFALGIKTAFGANADFDAMFGTTNGNMAFSKVIHKTFIEVDEKGTEAAAVTALLMKVTSVRPKPEEIIEFKADKPFTFLIRDNVSGETLFIGEYAFAQ